MGDASEVRRGAEVCELRGLVDAAAAEIALRRAALLRVEEMPWIADVGERPVDVEGDQQREGSDDDSKRRSDLPRMGTEHLQAAVARRPP